MPVWDLLSTRLEDSSCAAPSKPGKGYEVGTIITTGSVRSLSVKDQDLRDVEKP